jgi:hypothetical protein
MRRSLCQGIETNKPFSYGSGESDSSPQIPIGEQAMAKRKNFEKEYPLSSPYEFEGFPALEDNLGTLSEADGGQRPQRELFGNVGVVRNGRNAHGTWGKLLVWTGAGWVKKGYTLEPPFAISTKGPIPLGRYRFKPWRSKKLGKTLRLQNVPGFTDILIHVGNTKEDTHGCILVAKNVDDETEPTRLVNSRVLTDWLYDNHDPQCEGFVIVQSV